MDRNSANGIIDAQPLQQLHSEHHNHAGDASEENRAGRGDPVTGTSDGDQSGQESVGGKPGIPFLARHVSPEHGRQSCRASGQGGVGSNPADALKVHCRKSAAGVEAVPAKPQD